MSSSFMKQCPGPLLLCIRCIQDMLEPWIYECGQCIGVLHCDVLKSSLQAVEEMRGKQGSFAFRVAVGFVIMWDTVLYVRPWWLLQWAGEWNGRQTTDVTLEGLGSHNSSSSTNRRIWQTVASADGSSHCTHYSCMLLCLESVQAALFPY